ncbi:MAG TPA: hypothetical protein VEZ46_14540 [Mycobacteriales bacterium]|jgi:hypothetical protein|nr:hypothetical protein [Mycobacteriales bacterium]
MSWSWRYDIGGEQRSSSEFPTQGEAEAWLGESWQQLYDEGARSVALTQDGREVYPMSLEPA